MSLLLSLQNNQSNMRACSSSAFYLLACIAQSLPTLIHAMAMPRTAPPPQMAASSAAALTPAAAGQAVAEWCVAAEREAAGVAVSPATSMAAAMADFWLCARDLATDGGPVGRQRVLAFPFWDASADPDIFRNVLEHITECGELCEWLGESLLVAGRHPTYPPADGEPQVAPFPMIVLRSYLQAEPGDFATENYGEADPFANMDVPDGDLFAMDDVSDGSPIMGEQSWVTNSGQKISGGENWVRGKPTDTDAAEQSQRWLEGVAAKVHSDLTTDLPVPRGHGADGVTTFAESRAMTGEQIYEDFWRAIASLGETAAAEVGATCLCSPRFAPYNAGGYEAFGATLNEALEAETLDLGGSVQLVFFHPELPIVDEDVTKRVEYARRSPHPMVGIMKTPTVEEARRGSHVADPTTRGLIEVHERLCGPQNGLGLLS